MRDLNDYLNKLLRDKALWEKRIKELGGPDYAKLAPKADDDPQGTGGYRYFGAAKQLPGVKEVLQKKGNLLETTLVFIENRPGGGEENQVGHCSAD